MMKTVIRPLKYFRILEEVGLHPLFNKLFYGLCLVFRIDLSTDLVKKGIYSGILLIVAHVTPINFG